MNHHAYRQRLIVSIGIGVLILGGITYGAYRYYRLNQALRIERSNTTTLRASLEELQNNLSLTEYERDRLTSVLAETQVQKGELEVKAGALEEQTDALNDKVDDLTKLTTIDPELLKKYSKVYFLNEHYIPPSLTDIDSTYVYGAGRKLQILTDVWPHLHQLFDDASDAGLGLMAESSYRSFATQTNLKASYKVTYGTTAANKFSADQGYSEHQLGTTLDFTTKKTGTLNVSFENTPEFKWLVQHAYEYGFVLSYPKNNKYYIYEPWHWRFVGIQLATKLHEDGKYLYDLDQRDIDSYLLHIFD